MSQEVLQLRALGDFIHSKIEARKEAIDSWVSVPKNEVNAWGCVTAGFALVATGLELAADVIDGRDVTHAKAKSVGLHALAGFTASGAMLGGIIYGSTYGQHKAKGKVK
jgi:hypothetical protein